jgi:hypothetical protein
MEIDPNVFNENMNVCDKEKNKTYFFFFLSGCVAGDS